MTPVVGGIASVHVADVGARSALATVFGRRVPTAPGLRSANLALAAPLGASLKRPPGLGRIVLIAFWDDDDALDGFLNTHPVAERFRDGWSVRLRPLRAYGRWPGLPDDVSSARNIDADGPFVVLTLGRLHPSQTGRFIRASRRAERAAVRTPGMIWGTAAAKPPFVATCSIWATARELAQYAYGPGGAPHPDAIAADRSKPFHRQEAFIRFSPYQSEGHLAGANSLTRSVTV